MITKETFKALLESLGFVADGSFYAKRFDEFDCELKADFKNEKLIYPEEKGLEINERQTCNFKANENFVVFECVHRLLAQGYHPAHIELEPKWQVGHGASGGRADILVKDNDGKALLIIECKTAGSEFKKAWDTTQTKATQLFTYYVQERSTKFIALYASDFVDEAVRADYYLIAMSDNGEILAKNPKLKSYRDSNTVEEIYKVWRDTYNKDYTTFGIFENNRAYAIGEEKPTSETLKNISSKDIQGKYHEFATILRQHNVSGRENAFDKLVNLFLCKVVDEEKNPSALKFYWKGNAYDNPFDFQDRLQQLYKEGMKEFLGEDITYIDNTQIDEAFRVFKNKPNATKDEIKEMFKKLKFFTNNDFAFIDVHNEKLFYQNFDVLLKISRMIQDIRLKGSEENQFLGDMFEGFLDQGVKQSEGQFFTPMPIVKFIINALPEIDSPRVIDYACGAGHFLNEYATIRHDARIVGIEKEYRLSKVAKVSSFMYGSEMEIIYGDALSRNEKVRDDSFDVLIANPPYSVKGFLETLSDEDRRNFELIGTVDEKSFTANNAIECFFIERAKQLLAKDGVAGIIVPSSILNKGAKSNIYVATRELLLKYFEIVAIAEFGSGTFGKTGTNTVTLFLKRRGSNPDLADHLCNMANSWFEGDFESNTQFEDDDLLVRYCTHIGIETERYRTFLCENPDVLIFEHETFAEYRAEFEKLAETKNRRAKTAYKQLTAERKHETETKELIRYMKSIEKEKCYYFMLASKNGRDVVIVKSPSDNKESKKFLGYEWSSRKGDEGIKYLSSQNLLIEDENLDEEDKRILENLSGLKNISTPLYNPNNRDDGSRINKIIKDNFDGINTPIPPELQPHVSRARLVDMLDFTRTEFNKGISLSVSQKVEITSKWEIVKLSRYIDIIGGGTPKTDVAEYWNGNIPWLSVVDFNSEKRFVSTTEKTITSAGLENSSTKLLNAGDLIISARGTVGALAQLSIPMAFNQSCYGLRPHAELNGGYLYYILSREIQQLKANAYGSTFDAITTRTFDSIKIPLPPLDIQGRIVAECERIDTEVAEAQKTIAAAKAEIEQEVSNGSGEIVKLGDACEMKAGKFVAASEIYDEYSEGLFPCYGGNGLRGYVKTFTHDGIYPLIGRQGALCGNVTLVQGKFHATEHAVAVTPLIDMDIKWLYHELILLNLNQYATGTAQPGLSVNNIKSVQIAVPSLETQKTIVAKIETLEGKISEAKTLIVGAKERKDAILKKYL